MPSIVTGPGNNLRGGAVLAVAYGLVVAASLEGAVLSGSDVPVWPGAGVALAGLLLGGVRLWPAILIGRLVAGLVTGSTQPFWAELVIGCGHVLGAVLPVLLLQRAALIDLRLINMKDVLWLAAAGALGAAVSAIFGTATSCLISGFGENRVLIVGTNWWFANMVGTLTVAPLILAWSDRQSHPMQPAMWLHLGLVILATMLLAYLVFLTPSNIDLRTYHIWPVLIWAALAFQVRGASLALLILSVAAVLGATLGLGPFIIFADSAFGRTSSAQQFAAVTSVTILILAAVADERRGKEALAQLNADLERRVQEGASRLAQLQKIESLGQLTGGIAHDFNNLLMAVQGSLELLKKRLPPNDERAARLVANAMEGAQRGAKLTQRLLAFARKQELRPEALGIPDLVLGMCDLLERSLGPQVRIETRLDPDLPKALVDANQLEMAILNLAVNARDAMPEGGSLVITADEVRSDGGEGLGPGSYISLRVTDTGTGMDEATLRRATEPFFTTKGVGKGTGLGLSMAYGLAEQSGGRFTLSSEPGRRTTAEILLPVAMHSGEDQRTGKPEVGLSETAAVPTTGGLSVLVVDDDVLVRMGTADMVEDAGHVPVEAGSGPEALAVLRSGRSIDVVVTDQAMPDMTGTQLAAAIRAEFPRLPIILASGYADVPAEVDQLVAARLSKPFGKEELANTLARAIAPPERVVHLRPRHG